MYDKEVLNSDAPQPQPTTLHIAAILNDNRADGQGEAPPAPQLLTIEEARERLKTIEEPIKFSAQPAFAAEIIEAAAVLSMHAPGEFADLETRLKKARTVPMKEWRPMVDAAFGVRAKALRGPDNAKQEEKTRTLLEIIESDLKLSRDEFKNTYAVVNVNGYLETLHLKGDQFRDWLNFRYFLEFQEPTSPEPLNQIAATLQARAFFSEDVDVANVHVRLAEHDGAIYLDLCNARRQQVKITKDGWEIIEAKDCPIHFVRPAGMLPIPTPTKGGSVQPLRALLNLEPTPDENGEIVKEDQQEMDMLWALTLAWEMAALKPANVDPLAYPLIAINGEHGSAKTTFTKLLRTLVDPHEADARAFPKDLRDLAIAAERCRILGFDNMTHINEEASNALCGLSTGRAFAVRTLYSNDGESIFKARRLVILNGINDVVAKPDLLDRTIIMTLPVISPSRRKREKNVYDDFRAASPGILGALLDGVAHGLKTMANGGSGLKELPRMADFIEWATCCEGAWGFEHKTTLRAFLANQRSSNEMVLETSYLATHLMDFMRKEGAWEGMPSVLLKELNRKLADNDERPTSLSGWPQNARKLSSDLRTMAEPLRRAGLKITFPRRTRDGAMYKLVYTDPAKKKAADEAAAKLAAETAAATTQSTPDAPTCLNCGEYLTVDGCPICAKPLPY